MTRSAYGGSCYLNNAAVAATALRAAGHDRVAVVDIDAHHGNGTQAVFYDRADVLYASTHVDPGAGWFPHYAGFADETGTGAGRRREPQRPARHRAPATWSGSTAWTASPRPSPPTGARALVVSLGVDAAADDPESPLQVTTQGYADTGGRLAALGLPTVLVQEGGYHLATIGDLVVATLGPFAS